jgi:hypothetical protein
MSETPASSVPDLATGVPAVPSASEPAPASEPVPAPVAVPAIDVPAVEVSAVEVPATAVTAEVTAEDAAPADGEALLPPEPPAPEQPLSEAPATGSTAEVVPPPPPTVTPVEVEAVDPGEPRVAATLEVEPLPPGEAGSARPEGGEWDLLLGKVKAWLDQADLPGQWERLGGPLRGLGVLLGLLLVLKLYVALLDTLDDLLLLPRLLQLVGLIALLRFSVTRLTRSGDRQAILEDWKRRWDAFRGS